MTSIMPNIMNLNRLAGARDRKRAMMETERQRLGWDGMRGVGG